VRLGSFDLVVVSDGTFRLDGGAMFGVVPRTLWERHKHPDEKNRIRMGTNCLLIATGADLVLVDTGLGDKQDAKFQEIYAFDPTARRLPESIAAAGYELGDVTHVVSSHLHFDHSGWNAREGAGTLVPTFPLARYWLNRGEVEHARQPNERDRASYDPRNWEPLFAAGVVELFDDEAQPIGGVRVVKTPGHNADMCIVLLDGGTSGEGAADHPQRAAYWADLVPTTAHVPAPWVMGYDLYPLTTMANKQLWLPRACRENWLCVFEHDAETPLARLVEDKPGRYRAVAVDAEQLG
jgi:glyoxylase-like metal-dependent hydrolase (beta-lactamase superfamily II)